MTKYYMNVYKNGNFQEYEIPSRNMSQVDLKLVSGATLIKIRTNENNYTSNSVTITVGQPWSAYKLHKMVKVLPRASIVLSALDKNRVAYRSLINNSLWVCSKQDYIIPHWGKLKDLGEV